MVYPEHIGKNEKGKWYLDIFWEKGELEFVKPYLDNIDKFLGMHSHSFYEMNIIVDGSGRHYIENEFYDVDPGNVFIIPPGIEHGYYTNTGIKVYHILINHTFFHKYRHELNNIPGYALLFKIDNNQKDFTLKLDNAQLQNIVSELHSLDMIESDNYKGKEVLKNAKLLYIIGTLSKYILSKFYLNDNKNDDYAINIINSAEYIHSHFKETITVEMLTKIANLSRSTFLRHFSAIFKCSPAAYITNCRIDKAKELLQFTNESIMNIALECGFYDSSHFIKIFLKYEGVTPIQYKQLIKI